MIEVREVGEAKEEACVVEGAEVEAKESDEGMFSADYRHGAFIGKPKGSNEEGRLLCHHL